jgi:hypothetical protein
VSEGTGLQPLGWQTPCVTLLQLFYLIAVIRTPNNAGSVLMHKVRLKFMAVHAASLQYNVVSHRDSIAIERPTSSHSVRFSVAASASACGNDVPKPVPGASAEWWLLAGAPPAGPAP